MVWNIFTKNQSFIINGRREHQIFVIKVDDLQTFKSVECFRYYNRYVTQDKILLSILHFSFHFLIDTINKFTFHDENLNQICSLLLVQCNAINQSMILEWNIISGIKEQVIFKNTVHIIIDRKKDVYLPIYVSVPNDLANG